MPSCDVPSFWRQAVGLYLHVPATGLPRILLPCMQSSIRAHICCIAPCSLCKAGEDELYAHPTLLHKNASLPLELRFCFHQHHRPSKSDCSMRHHFYTSCTPSHSSSISRVHIVLITHTRPNLQHQLHFCDHNRASMYSPIRLCFSSKVIRSTRHRPHQRIPLSRAAPSVGSHACSTSVLLDRMQGRTLGASAPASDH